MELKTTRMKIMNVVERWSRTYADGEYGEDKLRILKLLKKLDLKNCSAEDVKDIIGNNSWSTCFCNECLKYKEIGISFDQHDFNFFICNDCLLKAVKVVKNAKEVQK